MARRTDPRGAQPKARDRKEPNAALETADPTGGRSRGRCRAHDTGEPATSGGVHPRATAAGWKADGGARVPARGIGCAQEGTALPGSVNALMVTTGGLPAHRSTREVR